MHLKVDGGCSVGSNVAHMIGGVPFARESLYIKESTHKLFPPILPSGICHSVGEHLNNHLGIVEVGHQVLSSSLRICMRRIFSEARGRLAS